MEGRLNDLADALLKFDIRKIADICPYWQNQYNFMILQHPIYWLYLTPQLLNTWHSIVKSPGLVKDTKL